MGKYQVLILDILNASKDHLSAEQIYLLVKLQLPTVSMSTIMRNVNQLVVSGKIKKVSISANTDCFESTLHEHQHLFCDGCKKLSNIHIDGLRATLEAHTKESITSCDVCIHYLCETCRKKLS